MANNEALKQLWAGIFVAAGICLIAGVIYFIGFQRGFTEPRFEVHVLFDRVGGLTESAPVRLSGVTVGQVDRISFLDQEVDGRGIDVKLAVYKKFARQVRSCTKVTVLTEGILGAKYVEMAREVDEPALDLEHPVMGEPTLDVYDLAEVLQDTAASFNETTKGINTMVVDLSRISRKTKRLMDRVEQRVIDGNLFKLF
jgi:ABC-type transporter Mla subunit MlaD